MEVPPVLLSGNHKKIEVWKEEMQVEMTTKWRSDLLGKDN
jgi:tRNA (guanine37-N1)-methyltransferase